MSVLTKSRIVFLSLTGKTLISSIKGWLLSALTGVLLVRLKLASERAGKRASKRAGLHIREHLKGDR